MEQLQQDNSQDSGACLTAPGSHASHGAATASPPTVSIPSADNSGPDWFEVAKALATAIMFNRGTRGEHVVGRDGRVRMGMVDLLGCYAVDEAAREFFDMAGLPFVEMEAPTEQQAMFMAITGRKWHHWFTDRDAIVQGAGVGPGRGKVDMDHLAMAAASAMSAGTAETVQQAQGQSPASAVATGQTPNDRDPSQNPTGDNPHE